MAEFKSFNNELGGRNLQVHLQITVLFICSKALTLMFHEEKNIHVKRMKKIKFWTQPNKL